MGSKGHLNPRPHLLFPRQRCLIPLCLTPEEHTAQLRLHQTLADQQLLQVEAAAATGQASFLLAVTVGAESCELPQCFHYTLHQEQLHDLLLQEGLCQQGWTDGQVDRWPEGRPGGRGVEKPVQEYLPTTPMVGNFPVWFTFRVILKK